MKLVSKKWNKLSAEAKSIYKKRADDLNSK